MIPIKLIAVVTGIALATTGSPTYIGILYNKKAADVQLFNVSNLAAVWLGASTAAPSWLQAGLAGTATGPQYVYIEQGRDGKQTYIREWPVPLDHLARIRLQHMRSKWRVIIDGHRSVWVRLRHAISITVLETHGPASAIINGKVVSGG